MSSTGSTANDSRTDIGTLWTMRRKAHVARCALMASVGDWELRIVVNGETHTTRRCGRGSQAFALADVWKQRMLDEGWRQVLPGLR